MNSNINDTKNTTKLKPTKTTSTNIITINRKRKRGHSQYIKNLDLFHINIDSKFIIDLKNPDIYFNKISNKNCFKLKDNEYEFLCQISKKPYNDDFGFEKIVDNFIELSDECCNQINEYFNVPTKKSDIEEFIEKKLKANDSRDKISCRKLAKAYTEETGKKISKTYINNLLRNNFKLSYLKTTVKTSKINTTNGIISSFLFIKINVKCLKLGYSLLYLDECSKIVL